MTGGAGFIGSAFVRQTLPFVERLVNVDLLTYAGNLENVSSVAQDSRYRFVRGNICDEELIETLCLEERVEAIVHFAAESHVDQSIRSPLAFLDTNVRGTVHLLEVVRRLPSIRFHHVSTDEVYGSLGSEGQFNEGSLYSPNSPYAASKAASDHFVRAYANTYGLSVTLSHCCNNYGPYQFPEKFLPVMILNCLQKKPLPLYGNGQNVRDWLYVDDHVQALWAILDKGKSGETYAIGAESELSNCDLLDFVIQEISAITGARRCDLDALITFVADRPGHDFRYAIDSSKIKSELGWTPKTPLKQGLRHTIAWYYERFSASIGSLC